MAAALLTCLLLAAWFGARPGQAGSFWHISDLHLDYDYVTGGNTSTWCHAAGPGLADETGAGPAGEYSCDSPYRLVMSALGAMHRIQPRPDFIVWTGDSAPHWRDPAPPSATYIQNVTKRVFKRLDQLFPSVPVVPAFGNHDASPPNQFPVSDGSPDQFPVSDGSPDKTPEYYKSLWSLGAFGDHINTTQGRETFQKCGYYTKVLNLTGTSARFVVLNTNIYYGDNYSSGSDPCGQLDWLDGTLHNSTEKVFIVAHVPPGGFERGHGEDGYMKINFNRPADNYHKINQKFVQIVTKKKYAEKISGHLYGHLHTDTFRLFLDPATRGEPRAVGFMAGSVTPVVWAPDVKDPTAKGVLGTNPSVRLFTYKDDDLLLKDFVEYSLDIVTANNRSEAAPRSGKKMLEAEASDGRRRREAVEATAGTVEAEAGPVEAGAGPVQTTADPVETTNGPTLAPDAGALVTTGPTPPADTETPGQEAPATGEEDQDVEDEIAALALQWKLLYTATEAFNVSDLSAAAMFGAVKAMVEGGAQGAVFQAYYAHNTAGHKVHACDTSCWRDHLCAITKLVESELNTCLKGNGTSGFYYEKKKTIIPVPGPAATVTTTTTTTSTYTFHDNDNLTIPPDVDIAVSTGPRVEPVPQDSGDMTTRAVLIFFSICGVLALAVVAALGYKKYRDGRYRNQEFLLTDSVFRYDGYSQLDDD